MPRLFAVALALAACAFARVEAAAPQPAARVPPPFLLTELRLELVVDYARPAIEGTATLTVRNVGTAQIASVPLLLNRLMSIRRVRDAAGRVLAFSTSVDVFVDDPFMQVRRATVTLPAGLPPGRSATFVVAYGGPLVGYAETGSLYIKDRIDPDFTILRSDALAFPVVGVPSDAANRAMGRADFAFDARIDVPETQVVAAGGVQVERQVSGNRAVYHFAGRHVPFLNIAIAPYRVSDRGGLRVYALPADAERGGTVADAGLRAMALLEQWFGPLPSTPAVTVIEIPVGFGSQASATAGIILDAEAFRDAAQLPQLYHELTHLWNAPDLDAPSPRWNEGLAMFLQYRLAREIDAFTGTDAALERARTRLCDGAVGAQLEATPFARFGVAGTTDFSYRVGLLMFSALERLVGRETFDARIRQHLQAHFTSGTTARQFFDTLAAPPLAPVVTPFLRDWFETSAWRGPVCSASSFEEAASRWRR